ncbi:MAG: formyltransferase family protein [Bacteroidia bacterium]|nr:formyltransferase family protein [Bacteroidia bacterium]
MRIIFIGAVEFSYKALETIIREGGEVVGVVTKAESKVNADFKDLAPLCEKHNIPYKHVRSINHPNNIAWMQEKNPDILFCFGWSYLLKTEVLNLAPMGVIGYHPAELPKNRGRHPLIWAIALGLPSSASTFFFMDEGADTGDILSQQIFSIEEEEYAKDIYEKMQKTALDQIAAFLPQLENGTYKREVQDHSLANNWRKRGFKDGLIDFRMSSRNIYNLVRALSKPYVGASIMYQEEEVKIWRIEILDFAQVNLESGKVLDHEGTHLLVKTGDGAVRITEHTFTELPPKGTYL